MQIVGKSTLICLKKYFLVVLILVFLHLCMIAASAASRLKRKFMHKLHQHVK